MPKQSEFTVANAYQYDHRNARRWVFSHLWRHKWYVLGFLGFATIANATFSYAQVLIGQAAAEVINPESAQAIINISLAVLAVMVTSGITDLAQSLSTAVLAQRLEQSTREELYASLLGKSQTFHDRQRVGDVMALATDDVQQMNVMINPGIFFIWNTIVGIALTLLFIGLMNVQLLLVPLGFLVAYIFAVRTYSRRLNPVANKQRMQFGKMNAVLEETISGIEIVKASAREGREMHKFRRNAKLLRDYVVKQGFIEAGYLPLLFYGITVGLSFLHAVWLFQQGTIALAQVVGFMALVNALQFPAFISIFSLTLVQLGLAGAERILRLIRTETEMDQNESGHSAEIKGQIVFENVTFKYGDNMVLDNLSFEVRPGKTVAIVGQTGSGKSTLTQLINRTYDASSGRILVDGVDVRDWSLDALRSQISKIEQDVFLFSRTLAENIAFGAPNATREEIEQAAKEAQAHEFILSFKDGYQTEVGERGVTLSGGQRQRIALARAFLSNPRILILDDSTSAIDSATEDEIQKAIRRAQQGRTTILITHRLSQIRWANHIIVLDKGKVIAQGQHEELLRTSRVYRRIFARYDPALKTSEVPTMAIAGD
ncbi:MAG: ABC transporter ATP-binding protein [Chloroflexi bacterium]|nr:ABC transporter ATP-binding protein [Chloroflexota bacterium]